MSATPHGTVKSQLLVQGDCLQSPTNHPDGVRLMDFRSSIGVSSRGLLATPLYDKSTPHGTIGMGLQSHASGTPVPQNSRPLGVGLELSVDGTVIHGLPLPPQVISQTYYIGIDEVARGCLAGPVVSCAMCLDITKIKESASTSNSSIPKICDSKKLSHKARALAESWIKTHALSYAIGQANVTEIDEINIREATFLAMNRALVDCIAGLNIANISLATLNIIVDGNAFKIMPGFEAQIAMPNIKVTTLVKGDTLDINIACASIIAKEFRDKALDELVINEPSLTKYNWHNNRAYGTAEHIRLIREHGVSQHHRRTFLKKILSQT